MTIDEQIIELSECGLTYKQISADLNVSVSKAQRVIRAHNDLVVKSNMPKLAVKVKKKYKRKKPEIKKVLTKPKPDYSMCDKWRERKGRYFLIDPKDRHGINLR